MTDIPIWLQVGGRCRVRASADRSGWRADWIGIDLIIVGISYARGPSGRLDRSRINVTVVDASYENDPGTDGFSPDDLEPFEPDEKVRALAPPAPCASDHHDLKGDA